MDVFVLFVRVAAAGGWGLLRRVVRGPRYRGWGWAFDALVSMQRESFRRFTVLGAARFRRASDRLSPVLTSGVPWRAVEEGAVRGCWLEPADVGSAVILYLHGGGYGFGSMHTHGNLIGAVAKRARARTFALSYRLAPEHPLPAALDDTCAAFRHLVDSGVPPERIVLAGDSAGGGLVLLALLALRDGGGPMPAGGVAISPWVDLANSGESFDRNAPYDYVSREACALAARDCLAGRDPRSPSVSPLFADLRDLPPVLVQAGEVEVLVDQIRAFAEEARRQGAPVELSVCPGMVHVWHMLVGFAPEAEAGIAEAAAFVERAIARSTPAVGPSEADRC